MTLSPEHYAFLDKLVKPLEWDKITNGWNNNIYSVLVCRKGFSVWSGEKFISLELNEKQAKAAARKHQLETIAEITDIEGTIDAYGGDMWRFWVDKCRELAKKCDELQAKLPVWQPIETAPKDGSKILLRGGYFEQDDRTFIPLTAVAHFDLTFPEYPWECDPDGSSFHKDMFTHWMPLEALPTPPETEKCLQKD